MNLPQSPKQDTTVFRYEIMDLSNISSDIMTTSSDSDIPNLEDISDCLDSLQDWFVWTFSFTPLIISNTRLYIQHNVYKCIYYQTGWLLEYRICKFVFT